MIIKPFSEVEKQSVQMDGVKGVYIRWLIGEKDNPPNFFMRYFEIEPGGHTPFHTHDWEHEVYVLAGQGVLVTGSGERELKKDYFVLVQPEEEHQFKNTGTEPMKFLCLIPKK